jgi:hypothetical protein
MSKVLPLIRESANGYLFTASYAPTNPAMTLGSVLPLTPCQPTICHQLHCAIVHIVTCQAFPPLILPISLQILESLYVQTCFSHLFISLSLPASFLDALCSRLSHNSDLFNSLVSSSVIIPRYVVLSSSLFIGCRQGWCCDVIQHSGLFYSSLSLCAIL